MRRDACFQTVAWQTLRRAYPSLLGLLLCITFTGRASAVFYCCDQKPGSGSVDCIVDYRTEGGLTPLNYCKAIGGAFQSNPTIDFACIANLCCLKTNVCGTGATADCCMGTQVCTGGSRCCNAGTPRVCGGNCCLPGQTQCNSSNNCCTPTAQFKIAAVRSGPPAQMDISVYDPINGIGKITYPKLVNATMSMPSFSIGTKDPVTATITKIDPKLPAQVELRSCSPSGCCQNGDPVLAVLRIAQDQTRVRESFPGVPAEEHFLTVQNGRFGFQRLHVFVNGRLVRIIELASREVRSVDLADDLTPGLNTVTLAGHGPAGSSGLVFISDVAQQASGSKASASPYPVAWDDNNTPEAIDMSWRQE
jgi:hypothetical protein